MKLIRQMALILLMIFVGEVLNKIVGIPIPGNILGMVLLLIALHIGIIKLEHIEEISKFLLDHLPFFFIPTGVGLLSITGLLKDSWYLIAAVIALTTIIVMASTGIVIQLLRRGKKA